MEGLTHLGHDVRLYWLRDDINRKSVIDESVTNTKLLTKKYLKKYLHEPSQIIQNFDGYRDELEILENDQPDIVISRVSSYLNTPKKLMRKTGIPFVIEVDSPSSYENIAFQNFWSTKAILYKMEKDFITGGKAAFTVSNCLKAYFVERGIPEEYLTVIPNGADPERFSPDLSSDGVKEKYGLSGSLVIGFVGSFIYWHGIENLMQIIQNTLKTYPEVKFLMVGDGGGLKTDLERFIQENGFEERAILTGFVNHDEVPQYIAAMDIALAPYPKLDFFYYSPVKIYEYMSCGKALVSSRIGQIAEVVTTGKNGMLIEPDDIIGFQNAIFDLIENEQLRDQIGENARHEILSKHTWEIRSKALSKICETVM